jgi:argininosuccinate lyase
MKGLDGKQKDIERKKAVYFDSIESGKLSLDLVSERLEQIKTEKKRTEKLSLKHKTRLITSFLKE